MLFSQPESWSFFLDYAFAGARLEGALTALGEIAASVEGSLRKSFSPTLPQGPPKQLATQPKRCVASCCFPSGCFASFFGKGAKQERVRSATRVFARVAAQALRSCALEAQRLRLPAFGDKPRHSARLRACRKLARFTASEARRLCRFACSSKPRASPRRDGDPPPFRQRAPPGGGRCGFRLPPALAAHAGR